MLNSILCRLFAPKPTAFQLHEMLRAHNQELDASHHRAAVCPSESRQLARGMRILERDVKKIGEQLKRLAPRKP